VDFRPATAGDFDAMYAVLVAAEGGLRDRHAFPWAAPPPLDAFVDVHAHLLRWDPGRMHVAVEDGRVVGYAAAFVRGGTWFLSDLFVDPAVQAHGIGTRLLELAWGDGPERRMTLADAIQPVSNAMYARRGLVPTTPVLELGGAPTGVGVVPDDVQLVDATREVRAAVDAAAYGFDRAVDHAFWGERGRLTGWARVGEPVAYSYAFPSGRVGPIAARDEESAAAALAGELARPLAREVTLDVPGSARALVELALAAGLRITGPPGLLLLSRGVEAPRALAISGYWLF
jgi:GNAT superfamily N-acetyltransferase